MKAVQKSLLKKHRLLDSNRSCLTSSKQCYHIYKYSRPLLSNKFARYHKFKISDLRVYVMERHYKPPGISLSDTALKVILKDCFRATSAPIHMTVAFYVAI